MRFLSLLLLGLCPCVVSVCEVVVVSHVDEVVAMTVVQVLLLALGMSLVS